MLKDLVLSRRNHVVTEHKGYKLVQYKNDFCGQTFCNAEMYKDDKLEFHATTRKIMDKEDSKEYIENYIEFRERILEGRVISTR